MFSVFGSLEVLTGKMHHFKIMFSRYEQKVHVYVKESLMAELLSLSFTLQTAEYLITLKHA